MAILWLTALLMLLATTTKASLVNWPTLLESTSTRFGPLMQTLSVFENGPLEITEITVRTSHSSAPPKSLIVIAPLRPGVYPVLLFVHGMMIRNYDYSDMFKHIASHGYVVVAPQYWWTIFLYPTQYEEIEMTASVANWLSTNLQNVLPPYVVGDLSRLAVSGHSRGGKTAFALALGLSDTKLEVQVAALIGVDPVAGKSKNSLTKPDVLTYVPNSFNLSIPTMVIGTGLGNQTILGQACAPNEVNYEEFFNESKESTLFVVKDSGHMDMLNNFPSTLAYLACVGGNASKHSVRRTIGGVIVAYLESCFLGEPSDYDNIIANPSLAPAKLFPIKIKIAGVEARSNYSQM